MGTGKRKWLTVLLLSAAALVLGNCDDSAEDEASDGGTDTTAGIDTSACDKGTLVDDGTVYVHDEQDLWNLVGYTVIDADEVNVSGSDLPSLDLLHCLTEVTGGLELRRLTDLSGLDNLTTVGGKLLIEDNHELTSLAGLGSLTSVGELIIDPNRELVDLTGLESLTTVAGDVRIGQDARFGLEASMSWIYGNDALTSLAGLDNLTSIGGDLTIGHNDSLASIEALSSLEEVGSVYVLYNLALPSLDGLEGVTAIYDGGFVIAGNTVLDDVGALSGLTTLTHGLAIYENTALADIEPLKNVEIPGDSGVLIHDNASLPTCAALDLWCTLEDEIDTFWDVYITENNDDLECVDPDLSCTDSSPCPYWLMRCSHDWDSECADMWHDLDNCGGCGISCPDNATVCMHGECAGPAGEGTEEEEYP